MSKSRRVCIYGEYNAWPALWNAAPYEFSAIIAEMEGADLIAPPPRPLKRRRDRILNAAQLQLHQSLSLTRPARGVQTEMHGNYDLFIFVGSHLVSLGELRALPDWKRHAGVKVAYVIEAWSASLASQSAYLKALKDFDYVFTVHKSTAPIIEAETGVPCTFLPTGVDMLRAMPHPDQPTRSIDLLSVGRRSDEVHRELLRFAEERNLFYDFDTFSSTVGTAVGSWPQHRALYFSKLKRAKFFVCFDHATGGGKKAAESHGEHAVPSRYFEGAACGAVLIGSTPKCAEFSELFPWTDAVIELPDDSARVTAFVSDLESQTERLDAVRRASIIGSARSHDWGHRWRDILNVVGLEPCAGVLDREARLREKSDSYSCALPTGRDVAVSPSVGAAASDHRLG